MSTKPAPEKLLIRGNVRVLFVNAPRTYQAMIKNVPASVIVMKDSKKGPVDVIQLFVSSKRELEEQLSRLKSLLAPKGMVWVTYPKGTSGVKTDVNRDIIREYAGTLGLEAVAIASVDDTWSALRLNLS